MKELQTRNAPKLRILETETDYHILYTEESVSTTAYGFRLSWGALAVLAAIGMLCLTLFVAAQGRDPTPPPPSSPSVAVPDDGPAGPPPDSVAYGLDTSGFVFPDSGDRLLTEADIAAIAASDTYTVKELLRFAVNEIYARNGYEFSTAFYREFYRQFDWYEGGLTAEQAVAGFNRRERKNVDFLLSMEEQYSS